MTGWKIGSQCLPAVGAVAVDAMFRPVEFAKALGVPAPAGSTDVIRVMLGKRLDFAPGERYAYSNLGYNILGRIIERKTGQSYEQYVTEKVLGPLGIRGMRLGKTHLEGRHPGEVRYYDPEVGTSVFAADLGVQVPQTYGAWHLEAMDSHGAWTASAVDLARFACAFDDPAKSPLLAPESMGAIPVRPEGRAGFDAEGKPTAKYYGLGWMIEADAAGRVVTSHGGSLPGTSTLLARRDDGRNVVLLFNTRTSVHASRLATDAFNEVTAAIDGVRDWPKGDLFRDGASTAASGDP